MEVSNPSTLAIHIAANDDSETGNARRQAMKLATALDFSELRCGQLGLVVTESARNVALHGGGGQLLLTPWKHESDGEAGVDVLALDKGAGIADIGSALTDGFSTGGTAGTGLGAVGRLSDMFQIYSKVGQGTATFARVLRSEHDLKKYVSPRLGAVNLPIAGEILCGDAWASHHQTGRSVYILADGLGHGPLAHAAAEEAVRSFQANAAHTPKQILQAMHLALVKTRGAAIAIAEVLHDRQLLHFAGSGNISASLHGKGRPRSLVSMNGTPGHTMGSVQEYTYAVEPESLLILHSDGLSTRWSMDDYPGLATRHPALIAGILFRDFSRSRDDATIVVIGV